MTLKCLASLVAAIGALVWLAVSVMRLLRDLEESCDAVS